MKRIKTIILNYILKNLFNTISVDDILVYNPNDKTFIVAGNTLSANEKQDIITGARGIKDQYVWKMIVKDMKYQSNKMMFEKSQSIDDLVFGKVVLYVLDVIEKKLKDLSNLQ